MEYETKFWHGLKAGLTVYTSQGLFFNDSDKDGNSLLGPGQKGYSVLGKAYFEGRFLNTSFRIYRQGLESPLFNTCDYRMTSVTVEAYTLECREIKNLALVVSHITKIKLWNDNGFKYMSAAAGYTGTSDPVSLVGAIYSLDNTYKIQVWNCYCYSAEIN